MDKEYEGVRIKNWIEASNSDYLSQLNGCEISNEESIWEILNVDNQSLVIAEDSVKENSRTTDLNFLNGKTVFIPEQKIDLIKDIDSKKSPIEALEDRAELILKQYSISPNLLNGGATILKFAKILDEWDKTQTVPNENDRIYLYESAKQSKEVSRAIAPLLKKWCETVESDLNNYDASTRLGLAVLLRVAGKFDESLEVSSLIDLPQSEFNCSQHMRAMICCDRAAVFLDKFERNHNRDYLEQAEKYLKRAFANEQSEAVSLCYQRFKSFREMK